MTDNQSFDRELLDGKGIDYPPVTGANVTCKRALKAKGEKTDD